MAAAHGAREIALLALSAGEQQGAWSDGYLKKAIGEARLESRDAALATKLCFGVLQNKQLLDFYIRVFSTVAPEKMECSVLNALRLGAYQIAFLTRVPQSAAVNEAVNLTRKYAKNPRAVGLVNGVLRTIARNAAVLPQPEDLETRYSHPRWLVKEFRLAVGTDQLEALLAADNEQPPTMAQVNTCRAQASQVIESLEAQGVTVARHPWLPDCLMLSGTGDLEHLAAFQEGLFYIQDAAAKLALLAAQPAPGMRVLDACAAPGGKSFAVAVQMRDIGSIFSCDIHPHKEKLIQAGADRLGLTSIKTAILDAKQLQPDFVAGFDLVIADVPCSGLGIIRKKPDIREKDPRPLANLPAVQAAILENVANYVKPGGVLLYATCTLLARENGGVVTDFLGKRKDFTLQQFQLPEPIGTVASGMLTLWPHLHGTDGFFMAKLRRS